MLEGTFSDDAAHLYISEGYYTMELLIDRRKALFIFGNEFFRCKFYADYFITTARTPMAVFTMTNSNSFFDSLRNSTDS